MKKLMLLMFFITACMLTCGNNNQTTADARESRAVTPESHVLARDSGRNDKPVTDYPAQYEWPCFHGTDRTNKSGETGLLKSWPEEGLGLIWSVSGLGEGYASVSIADGRIFTSGTDNNQTYVFAYDLDGNLLWEKPNGAAWKVEVSWANSYNGPRSTPTYDDGRVYHLSELNRLTAYNSKTGEIIWSKDLLREFSAEMPDYGYSESILIDGDRLFTKPAGKKGFQVCLNKLTGETIWVNNEIPGLYGYNSPVLHDFGGYRQLISASSNCYYGLDTDTGKLLWTYNFTNRYGVNCTDAVIVNEYVFLSNGEGGGSALVKLNAAGADISVEKIWETAVIDNYHGGMIYHDGYIYGSRDRNRGWTAIEMLTGKQMWNASGSMGSITFAEGMLYLLDEKGRVKLIKASPENFEAAGEFRVPRGGRGPFWAHPVVCGGRLYVRHTDKLYVYDIKGEEMDMSTGMNLSVQADGKITVFELNNIRQPGSCIPSCR